MRGINLYNRMCSIEIIISITSINHLVRQIIDVKENDFFTIFFDFELNYFLN